MLARMAVYVVRATKIPGVVHVEIDGGIPKRYVDLAGPPAGIDWAKLPQSVRVAVLAHFERMRAGEELIARAEIARLDIPDIGAAGDMLGDS